MSSKPTPFRWWLGGAAILAAAAIAVWHWGDFELKDLANTIAAWNPLLVIFLMAVLPVAGFSVSVVYLVAGAKFGPFLGGVVVTGVTAVHLLASHWIGRGVLRRPLESFLARRKHQLPELPAGENVAVAVMAALVPGLPYFVRNYLLALSGVPLRVYFWVCLPIYVARSYVAILVGDLGSDPDGGTLGWLAAVYAVKLAICARMIWRIQRRLKRGKTAAA